MGPRQKRNHLNWMTTEQSRGQGELIVNIHFIVLQSKNIQMMTSEKKKRKAILFSADENDKNQ